MFAVFKTGVDLAVCGSGACACDCSQPARRIVQDEDAAASTNMFRFSNASCSTDSTREPWVPQETRHAHGMLLGCRVLLEGRDPRSKARLGLDCEWMPEERTRTGRMQSRRDAR